MAVYCHKLMNIPIMSSFSYLGHIKTCTQILDFSLTYKKHCNSVTKSSTNVVLKSFDNGTLNFPLVPNVPYTEPGI